jgi:hypothetical protein
MPSSTNNPHQPQPITVTTNLDTVPAYAEQLGHLCVAWANLEWNMFSIFEIVCGAPPSVARSIFYAIESNRGKRDILLATAIAVLKSGTEFNVLDDIVRRIGKTAQQRNKYVHDTWCTAETQNREIFQLRLGNLEGDRDMEEVTLNDLKATSSHIKKLTGELDDYRKRVLPQLPALLEKLRQQPSSGLRFAKKGHPPGRLSKGHHGRQ